MAFLVACTRVPTTARRRSPGAYGPGRSASMVDSGTEPTHRTGGTSRAASDARTASRVSSNISRPRRSAGSSSGEEGVGGSPVDGHATTGEAPATFLDPVLVDVPAPVVEADGREHLV